VRALAALLPAVAACNFQRGAAGTSGDADGTIDAAILDAPIDAPPGSVCAGSFVEVCRPMAETMVDLTFDSEVIDTDGDLRCIATSIVGGPELCVIVGHNITINSGQRLAATGTRPLVFAAFDAFKIEANASLNVSSTGARVGAGANYAGCQTAGIAGQNGGGGAGGSMRGKGGNGGTAGGDPTSSGIARDPFPVMFPFVHGGCAGGAGGLSSGGLGGASGGAVLVIAKKKIDMKADSLIVASGAGGAAPTSNGGGGGGGSGGFIGLDVGIELTLDPGARFAANSGSGASGGTAGVGGAPGNDGDDSATGVLGGFDLTGGPGGDGSGGIVLTGGTGDPGLPTAGGGGGGGGAGAIILFDKGNVNAGVYSPQPTVQ
jgi:hypothetical protein